MKRTIRTIHCISGMLAATALVLSSSGCGIVKIGPAAPSSGGGNPESEWSRSRAARYDGPECRHVLYDMADIERHTDRLDRTDDLSTDKQLLLAVCKRHEKAGRYGHRIPQQARINVLSVRDTHYAFDDRNYDPVRAALMVVWAGEAFYEKQYAIDAPRIARSDRNRNALMGLMKMYVDMTDRGELIAALEKVPVPKQPKGAFLKLYDAAAARIESHVAGYDPAVARVLVKTPVAVARSRRDYFSRYAELFAELDVALVAAKKARDAASVDEGVVDRLVALRSDYIKRCAKADCQRDPFYADATRELALLHVTRGDALGAVAESGIYRRDGSYVAGFAQAIAHAQLELGNKVRVAHEQYKKAKKSGVDDATAVSMAGGERGYRFSSSDVLRPTMKLPNFAAAMPDAKVAAFSAVVKATRKKRGMTQVVFKTNSYTYNEAYACRRTDRIARVHSDGRIEYEENCKYRKKTKTSESHAPVVLPTREARGLRPGAMLTAVVRGGEARVVKVSVGDRVVQIRGDVVR